MPSSDTWPLGSERRLHTRHRARTKMTVRRTSGARQTTSIVNLSVMGCCARTTDMQLRVHEEVELNFFINLGTMIKIHKRKARVAWVRNGMSGFAMYAYELPKIPVQE